MKTTLLVAFLACVLALTGCGGGPFEDLPDLIGMTEAEVVEELGEPSYTGEIPLEYQKILPTKYSQIHNTYSPQDATITGIVIKEHRWEQGGSTKVVLYDLVGDTWTVLEAFEHDNDFDFEGS